MTLPVLMNLSKTEQLSQPSRRPLLSQSIDDPAVLTGPLVDIDPTPYANNAAELGVLSTLAELSKTEPLSQPSRYTLLSLMCTAIAAFELSPFTLPADQLQAVVKTLANLYEGVLDCMWYNAFVNLPIDQMQAVVAALPNFRQGMLPPFTQPAGQLQALVDFFAILCEGKLSPFTLPADQLQAVIGMLANLYEGKLCMLNDLSAFQKLPKRELNLYDNDGCSQVMYQQSLAFPPS